MRGRHHGGQGAHQEARLILVIGDADQVGERPIGVRGISGQELVDADELDGCVFLGSRIGGFGQVETDGDDLVVTGIREGGDVLVIVLGVGGLDVLHPVRHAISLGLLNAFPGGLVEGLVIHLADVRHQANAENVGLGAIGGGGGAGRDQHGDQHQSSNYQEHFLHLFFSS